MPLVLTSGIGAAAGANIGRLFKEAKAVYAPGGEYMKGIEAQLARGRTRAVAGGMQGLAAAGLAGTSMAGGLAKKYEEEVAAPAMAQATTARLSALSGLLAQEAQVQMQTAPRYGYQAPRQQTSFAPAPVSRQRQVTQPTQPARQPQQVLPPLERVAKTPPAPGGYGTYYGKAFYERQKRTTSPLSSYYGSSLNFDPGGELSI